MAAAFFMIAGESPAGPPKKPCPLPPEPGQEPAYTQMEEFDAGELAGRVTFSGDYTPMKWKVVKDREFCGDSIVDESLVASQDGGLRFVVVSIDDIKKGKPLPREVKEVANKDCRYQPHVEALSVCSKLMITNHDPIFHNTHGYIGPAVFDPQKPDLTHDGMWVIQYESAPEQSAAATLTAFSTIFNLGLPTQEFKPKKTVRKTGLITLKCDAGHTWMTGYVWVKPHPYVTVTGPSGDYRISDVPAGKHTVTFWHETLGTRQESVTIEKDAAAILDMAFTTGKGHGK